MCRFLAYHGEPVYLDELVCAPTHSLVPSGPPPSSHRNIRPCRVNSSLMRRTLPTRKAGPGSGASGSPPRLRFHADVPLPRLSRRTGLPRRTGLRTRRGARRGTGRVRGGRRTSRCRSRRRWFRSWLPPRRSLSRQIRARTFFAHVRASTGTATTRANCHPFGHESRNSASESVEPWRAS
jgi:hypothetical protein